MVNAASGNVSIIYGIHGPNTAVATACATGANAIGDAGRFIQYDMADVMIAGGAEARPLYSWHVQLLRRPRPLHTQRRSAKRPRPPLGSRSRWFRHVRRCRRRGFWKNTNTLKNAGARIYAELVGYGMSGDAFHITAPEEHGKGAARAMEKALIDAAINPDQVDYVNAHGTSTPLGDLAETRAMKSTFGPHAKKLAISSTKSQLGHSLGATGGVETVVAALAVKNNLVPPTINLDNPDPECDLDYVPHRARDMKSHLRPEQQLRLRRAQCVLASEKNLIV